jgi:hypothetical protein
MRMGIRGRESRAVEHRLGQQLMEQLHFVAVGTPSKFVRTVDRTRVCCTRQAVLVDRVRCQYHQYIHVCVCLSDQDRFLAVQTVDHFWLALLVRLFISASDPMLDE